MIRRSFGKAGLAALFVSPVFAGLAVLSSGTAKGGAGDTGVDYAESDTGIFASSMELDGTYICGLTDAEIDDVLSFYNMGITRQSLMPHVTAPFDCPTYGDACADIGPVRAETWTCSIWDRLRNHEDPQVIAPLIAADYEVKYQARMLQLHPNGVPSNDASWGTPSAAFLGGCPQMFAIEPRIVYDESGNYRVKSQSYYTNAGIYFQIGTMVTGYDWDAVSVLWRSGGNVGAINTFQSKDSGGTECANTCPSKSDTDGTVNNFRSGWGFNLPEERTNGTGSHGSADATSGRVANWNDC